MVGLEIDPHRTGLVVQSPFLTHPDVKKATDDQRDHNHRSYIHIDKRHGQRTNNQRKQQNTYAPINKTPLKTFVCQWPLKPPIDRKKPFHRYSPKKALTIRDERTRKRQLPPQPINSLLIS